MGCRCHSDFISTAFVKSLWILTEGTLHGNRVFHYHIIHTSSGGLNCKKCSTKNIGASWASSYAGHTAHSCHIDRRIHGVKAVNAAKLWGTGITSLIIILSLKTDSITIQSQMAVGIYKSRINVSSGRIHHFCSICFQMLSNGCDFSILYQNICHIWLFLYQIVDPAIFNTQHLFALLVR